MIHNEFSLGVFHMCLQKLTPIRGRKCEIREGLQNIIDVFTETDPDKGTETYYLSCHQLSIIR